jgi:hypothetical protein
MSGFEFSYLHKVLLYNGFSDDILAAGLLIPKYPDFSCTLNRRYGWVGGIVDFLYRLAIIAAGG